VAPGAGEEVTEEEMGRARAPLPSAVQAGHVQQQRALWGGANFRASTSGSSGGERREESRWSACAQGLTLVHFSAQLKRFVCERGCV
jgi:hypothetical protein